MMNADGSLPEGWRYATYSNGIGQGSPYQVSAAVNNLGQGGNMLGGLMQADYAQYATDPVARAQAQQVMSRTSPGASMVGDANMSGGQSGGAMRITDPRPLSWYGGMQDPRLMGGGMPNQWGGYGSQSGGMWGGQQQYNPYGSAGNYGQQSNQGGNYGNPYGGYSSYGGGRPASYGLFGDGGVAYRRGLLG